MASEQIATLRIVLFASFSFVNWRLQKLLNVCNFTKNLWRRNINCIKHEIVLSWSWNWVNNAFFCNCFANAHVRSIDLPCFIAILFNVVSQVHYASKTRRGKMIGKRHYLVGNLYLEWPLFLVNRKPFKRTSYQYCENRVDVAIVEFWNI